jgi:hypothetical protein
MNRTGKATLVSLVLITVLVVPGFFVAVPMGRANAAASWTYALYVDGVNSLAPDWAKYTLPALQNVPANSQVNIVAMVALKGASNVLVEKISGSSVTVVETDPVMDMGSGATLTWWIDKYTTLFPSTYNALLLWDHGFGWQYICTDDVTGHSIDMPSLQSAITNAGNRIDVLAFDACNMAMDEVAYQVSKTNLVSYMVASEEYEGAVGIPEDVTLTPLVNNPAMLPRDFAINMVNAYQQYYQPKTGQQKMTMAAFDVAQVGATIGTFTAWTTQMNALLPSYKSYYTSALRGSHTMSTTYYTDMGSYMNRLLVTSGVTDTTLRTATQNVQASMGAFVIKFWGGTTMTDCNGITFYWPNGNTWKTTKAAYMLTAFAVDTGWGNFLNAYIQ